MGKDRTLIQNYKYSLHVALNKSTERAVFISFSLTIE
jgi:hypothetical protein